MAIQRMSLAQIETNVLQLLGYASSAVAPWASQANFYIRVNQYMQRLPQKATALARSMGIIGQTSGPLRFDMWRATATSSTAGAGNIVVAAASATIYFPTDYDKWISLYDATNGKTLDVAEEVDRYHVDRLRNKPAGPPEACEILGMATGDSAWRVKATLHPATAAATTPSLILTYWRIPASMAGSSPSSEYPDIDAKFEYLAVAGTARDIAPPNHAQIPRLDAIEKEMLVEMALTGRAV